MQKGAAPLHFILIALISGIMLGVIALIAFPHARSLPAQNPFVPSTPIPTPKAAEAVSILLIGHGGEGHEGGTLADSMMIIRADIQKKQLSFISIPRDTWSRIPTAPGIYEYRKLNYAFSIGNDTKYTNKETQYTGVNGGGELAKDLVEEITGIPVDYYVSVDFAGLTKAIDILGGVEVNVPEAFVDYFYPIKGEENNGCGFPPEKNAELHRLYSGFELEKQYICRYEQLKFAKGVVHMDGATALKFVRSRHGSVGGDFARSQRQQALLLAIRDKAISMNALKDTPAFFRQFTGSIKTDLNEGILNPTLQLLGDPQSYSTKTINLSTDNVFRETYSSDRQYILVPKLGEFNWTGVQEFLKKELL